MLGIVSGALRDEVEGALRQSGLRNLFKVLITAEDVAEGKPDPEGYLRALEALNSTPPLPERLIHPHEVLAVEDSPAGLSAAADIGLGHPRRRPELSGGPAPGCRRRGRQPERHDPGGAGNALLPLQRPMSDLLTVLSEDVRRRLEQFVKPLYAGLDGVQTFDRVGRMRTHVAALQEGIGQPVDGLLLEILLLLHGVVDRLGSLAPGGRLDLFLKGLGLPDELVRAARTAPAAAGTIPAGPRKSCCTTHCSSNRRCPGHRERSDGGGEEAGGLARALAQLDPGPAAERYRTARGASLGAARRKAAEEWIEDLRRRAAWRRRTDQPVIS